MKSPAHLAATRRPRRMLAAGCLVLAALVATPASRPASAGDPVAAAIAAHVASRGTKPSVHMERPAIEQALAAAGVPPEAITRLFAEVARADLPGMAASLDVFLFLTRDPEWLAMRDRFAEFLELPGVDALDAARVEPLTGYGGVVTLPAVTELTPETAAALAAFGKNDWGAAVEFPSIVTISPAAAAAVAACPALLVFPNLERLSAEAAQALARHEGVGLVLGGLTTLPDDVAGALAEARSIQGLLLPDLESLDSPPLAGRLARQDHTFLPRVATLALPVAEALRGNEGGELALPGLAGIPPELAGQVVAAGYYWLTLGGGDSLAPEAAAILAGHVGQLTFTGDLPCSAAAAAKLAAHDGLLSFPHVAELPVDVARALAPHAGGLLLGGVTSLTPEVAAALAAHAGGVHLPGVRTLTPDVAAALAPRTDALVLSGLETLDAATAAAFAAHARDVLVIGGVTRLTPEAAAALAAFEGRLVLAAVTTLTPDVARALAAHRGPLVFESLVDLTAEVAAELAGHDGGLTLSAVERLSTAAAEALARAPGPLELPRLFRITSGGAAALARREAPPSLAALQYVESIDSVALAELLVAGFEDLALENLAALDGPQAAAIARVLARTSGSLSLPVLARITPRALETLLAKPDVDLPPVAELELAPDAGGGVSDDFIDPRP